MYKYSQLLNVVPSCHAADVSDFIPNPINHVLWLQLLLLSVLVVLLSLTYSHTEKSRGVKSGDHSGQAIIPPCPIQATTM